MVRLGRGVAGRLLRTPDTQRLAPCPADPCSFCATGSTPHQRVLVFSGVQPCTFCHSTAMPYSYLIEPLRDLNGTYVLTQWAPCIWRWESPEPDYVSRTMYPQTQCSGYPYPPIGLHLRVQMQMGNFYGVPGYPYGLNGWFVYMSTFGTGDATSWMGFQAYKYTGHPAACSAPWVIGPNEYTTCSPTGPRFAYNGEATSPY